MDIAKGLKSATQLVTVSSGGLQYWRGYFSEVCIAEHSIFPLELVEWFLGLENLRRRGTAFPGETSGVGVWQPRPAGALSFHLVASG